jgi:hypothetical protein
MRKRRRRKRRRGEVVRKDIKAQLVMVNATKIPEDIKSFKYRNGTKVATRVMRVPDMSAPFHKFPFESIIPNKLGSKPSRARAYCRRGCVMIVMSTTLGRANTSPA